MARQLVFDFNKLYQLAEAAGLTAKLEEELYFFKEALQQNYAFKQFFENPRLAPEYKKQCLKAWRAEQASGLFFAVIFLLIDRESEANFIRFSEGFTELVFSRQGKAFGEVFSVVPIEEKAIERVQRLLKKRTGQEVFLRNRLDARILGGLLIKLMPDRIFDLSLKSRLFDLKNKLICHCESR